MGVFEDGKGLKSKVMNDLATPGVKRWGRLGSVESANFSSYNLAKLIACDKEIGWKAWTSLLISGFNPEIKQLK